MNDAIKEKLKLIRDEANVLLSGLPSDVSTTLKRLDRIENLALEAHDDYRDSLQSFGTAATAIEVPLDAGVDMNTNSVNSVESAFDTVLEETSTAKTSDEPTDTAAWDESAIATDDVANEPVADEHIEDEAEPS